MVDLIVCWGCNHGVMVHNGHGCEALHCDCTTPSEYIVEEFTARARVEIARTRKRSVRRKRLSDSPEARPSLLAVAENG
jgi:hypothetical protein